VPMTHQEEQILKSLAARAAIGDLNARLNRAMDRGDANAWLSAFLPEGELVLPDRPDQVLGHPGLLAYLQQLPPDRVHLSADATIEVSGVTARHDAQYIILSRGANGSGLTVEAIGRVHDELVYERGGWYVARRELLPL
jgi:SnoaL-like domain